jgi:hypothetical protein
VTSCASATSSASPTATAASPCAPAAVHHLSSAMASTIQRYILKVERERNARERIR